MYRTFNMGVGMIFAVEQSKADEISRLIGAYAIGEVCQDQGIQLM